MLGQHLLRSSDEIIIDRRQQRIRIGGQTVSIPQISADSKIEKRIAVIEQRSRCSDLVRLIVNQQAEVSIMPVRIADDRI